MKKFLCKFVEFNQKIFLSNGRSEFLFAFYLIQYSFLSPFIFYNNYSIFFIKNKIWKKKV